MAYLPFERGRRSVLSQAANSLVAATTARLASSNSFHSASSPPAACLAQVATEPSKKPTEPAAMRMASSVNSAGGFFTLARAAANTAGTALSRAMTERSRCAGGAKSRLMRLSMAPPGSPAYGIGLIS